MTTIPLQDGKPFTKLGKGEDFGNTLKAGAPEYGSLKETNLLQVSKNPPHKIYWQEYGNSKGEPVFVVHGGPGGGCSSDYAKWFNQDRYRIILFDQRGCGYSEPAVSKDPQGALDGNNTANLIEDMNKLRSHLGIKGKMHICGGSWGSTLALAYSIAHPQNVKSLQLRGIFLCQKNVFDYFYQGNAASYDPSKPLAQQDFSAPGAYRAYLGDGSLTGQIAPEFRTPTMAKAYEKAWQEYVSIIPKEKRGDMVAAYSEILERKEPMQPEKKAEQIKAAKAWAIWEGVTSNLIHDTNNLGKFEDEDFVINFARIENRYFMHGCYLGMQPGQNPNDFKGLRDNHFILNNLDRIKDIPIAITHGRFDQVTLPEDAKALQKGVEERGGHVSINWTNANHSAGERENAAGLTTMAEKAPKMSRGDYEVQPQNSVAMVMISPSSGIRR